MAEKNQQTIQEQMQAYQGIVSEYEKLNKEIDALIMRNGGASKNMSDADRQQYRQLARRRSDLFNEMRMLERDLLDDE